jgi:putative acetyltransferase
VPDTRQFGRLIPEAIARRHIPDIGHLSALALTWRRMLAKGVIVREFKPGDEAAFRRLNEEWITRYFALEPKDEAALADPRGTILDGGGRIFLAFQHGHAVGCCALIATNAGEFEVAKMAVTEASQRAGIGRHLLECAIREARNAGARRLYLETNNRMEAAIRLYRSLSFRDVPPERVVPSPYVRSDVCMELLLDEGV